MIEINEPLIEKKANSQKIRFKEKNRVAELGWELVFYKDPGILSDNDRKKILFRVIKELVSVYRNKNYPRPMNPGHILISKPWDQKLHTGVNKFPELIRKRSSINSRCGFGNLDQYNYEIGIFDLQLKLNPI
jgi:hypothetical protein